MKAPPFKLIIVCTAVFGFGVFSLWDASLFAVENSGDVVIEVPGATPEPKARETKDCESTDIRYATISNVGGGSATRMLTVLLDPRDYSEPRLAELFGYLSRVYPDERTLLISVETDWDRVTSRSTCPTASSESGPDPTENESHRARFRRMEGRADFTYNPVLKTAKWKTVPMKANSF